MLPRREPASAGSLPAGAARDEPGRRDRGADLLGAGLPGRGHEENPPEREAVAEYERLFVQSVERRSAGRRAGRGVPVGRRRFERRGRGGEQGPRPADPDVHRGRSVEGVRRVAGGGAGRPARRHEVGRGRLRGRGGARHVPGADRGRRVPGRRYVGRGAVAAGPIGPAARLQGGPDRRRGRRVPGRLPVVQDAPGTERPGSDTGRARRQPVCEPPCSA